MDKATFKELRKRVRRGEEIQEEIMRLEEVMPLQSAELEGLYIRFTTTDETGVDFCLNNELAQLIADKTIAVAKKRIEQLNQEFNEL